MSQRGDPRLPDLREELTGDCQRQGAFGLHGRCKARFEF
jgi:hypothetical protein